MHLKRDKYVERFQKEMLTQIKKLNEKMNKNIKDLSKPEKKISHDRKILVQLAKLVQKY